MVVPQERASRTQPIENTSNVQKSPSLTNPHQRRIEVQEQILENLTLIELTVLSRLNELDPARSGISRLIGDIIFELDTLVLPPVEEEAPDSGRVQKQVSSDVAASDAADTTDALRIRELEEALIKVAAEEECMAEELADVANDAERCGTVNSGQLWDTIMWHDQLSKRMQASLARAFAHTNRIRTLASVYSKESAA